MQKAAIIVVIICLLTGCATMKGGISNYDPVGIVSVISNKVINWEGENDTSGGGLTDDFIKKNILPSKTANKVNYSEADTLIVEASNILFDVLNNSGIAEIAPASEILESSAYIGADIDKRAEDFGYIKLPDYKFINNADKDLAIDLALEKGIRSTMYVEFAFIKTMSSGVGKNGTMRAMVNMKVTILDENGKKIYFKTHEYKSMNRIEVFNAYYDEAEMMGLFQEALYTAVSDLVNQLNKK